jgi:hypothetical protein
MSAALIDRNQFAGILSDANEGTIGAYVPLNNDDDDYDVLHQEDKAQSGAIAGEDDLLPIILHKIDPISFGGQYTLTIPANIKVWQSPNRSGPVSNSTTFNATEDTPLWVEGFSQGTGFLHVNWNGAKTINNADTIKINVFTMTGPLNVPNYTIYEYTASGGRPGDSQWLNSSYATTQANVNDDPTTGLDYIDVFWDKAIAGNRYFVASIPYQASSGYVWQVSVNVVEVKISQAANTNVIVRSPTPIQQPGTAILHGSQGPTIVAQLDVESITGPTVNGGMRGVSFMQLGFVQTGKIVLWRGMYPDSLGIAHEYASVNELFEGVDALPSSTLPWYDSTNSLHGPNIHSAFAPTVDQQYTAMTFAIDDKPRVEATNVTTITIPAGAPNAGEVVTVDEYDVLVHFNTYFAVRTREGKPDRTGALSNTFYTRRTAAEWKFNAVGKVVGAGPGSFGTWSPSTQNTADTTNNEEFDGTRLQITTGTTLNQLPAQWILDPP